MRRVVLVTLAVLALAAYPAVTLAGSDNATKCVFTTQLRAENEVPTSTSEAFGHSQIKINNNNVLEWKTHIVNHENEPFTAGHVHKAPAGVAGPVVVPLFTSSGTTDHQIKDSGETGAPINGALADDICANPQSYYVNYHTNPGNPGGAVRGQLG